MSADLLGALGPLVKAAAESSTASAREQALNGLRDLLLAERGPEPLPSVQAAIAAVIRELPGIGKGGQAPANMGGFRYRGIEDMTRVIQPLLGKHGLIIVPQAREIDVSRSLGSKNDAMQDVRIRFDWLIVGPDGSTLPASTYGIGRDHTDKGGNKAQTQAYKYLLMHLFCVSDPADDGDGHDYTRAAADEPSPMAERDPADVTYERLAAIAAVPGARDRIKALGQEYGKGFSGNDLRADAAWRDVVNALLDRIEAEAAQDADAERAPARQVNGEAAPRPVERSDDDAARTAAVAQQKLAEAGLQGELIDPEQAAASEADEAPPVVAWTTCGYEPTAAECDAYLAETGKYAAGVCYLEQGHTGRHEYEEPF